MICWVPLKFTANEHRNRHFIIHLITEESHRNMWCVGRLLKLTFLHGCYSRFLNCTNGTKSRNASHIWILSKRLCDGPKSDLRTERSYIDDKRQVDDVRDVTSLQQLDIESTYLLTFKTGVVNYLVLIAITIEMDKWRLRKSLSLFKFLTSLRYISKP